MAELEDAKRRLDTALLRLEALATARGQRQATGDAATDREPLLAAQEQNRALQDEVAKVHRENVELRGAVDSMSQRLEGVLAKLEQVMEGADEPTKDNDK